MREIDINNRSKIVEVDAPKLRKFVRALDELLPSHLHAPKGTLSIAILDDIEMADLHGRFLADPTPTDVVTFEGDGELDNAGEVCVDAQTAARDCSRFGFTPDRELCLYVAHGYLHLAGVDDVSEEDAKKMRVAEQEALKVLDKKFRSNIFKFKG